MHLRDQMASGRFDPEHPSANERSPRRTPVIPSRRLPEDRRVPRRKVHFPEAVTLVSPEQIIDTVAFLALEATQVNQAEPALIKIDAPDNTEPQKAWKLPDGKVAIVKPFDTSLVRGHLDHLNVQAAHIPMASPNGKHVYVDHDQLEQAIRHGSFRNRIRAAEFNAGYNPVHTPEDHPNDVFFEEGTRF